MAQLKDTTVSGELTVTEKLTVNEMDIKAMIDDIYSRLVRTSSITENSNLNDYQTEGVYFCGTTTVAKTLTNSPTTDAFRLEVKKTVATSTVRIWQIIYPNGSGAIKSRNLTSTGWNAWK